jgi:hypothetical protein
MQQGEYGHNKLQTDRIRQRLSINGKEENVMNRRQTSKKVASKAGKILNDGRYGKNAKSVAGSALAQTKTSKKK